MSRHTFPSVRAAAMAAVCSFSLAGCLVEEGPGFGPKHLRPLSPSTVALIEQKGMSANSPILLRIFKEESELEIWKQTREGRYALLKTYPICRWSGELGPKIKEGDRQAPEGFYAITPELMNPRSSYYLAFNLGYPNEFDRAWGRTGAHLMVHGDCSSRGCYAMTDDQIQEIFALARESFDGGQLAFQVQAFPFRMTAKNMARHRKNPHLAFWRTLKEGHDHFELTRLEPKVDVCERRYVFNAHLADPSQMFDPKGPCPAYEVPQELATPYLAKKQADDREAAMLANLVPAAPIVTGRDGGTHQSFAGGSPQPRMQAPDDTRGVATTPATPRPGGDVTGSTGTMSASAPLPPGDPRRPDAQSVANALATGSRASAYAPPRNRGDAPATQETPRPAPTAQPAPAPQTLPGATPIRSANDGFSFQ